MPLGRAVTVLVALGTCSCTLAARDHACWPFLAHQYHGHVPREAVHALAHEHGTRKQVAHFRAPTGYYWRRDQGGTLDVRDVRTLLGGYELVRCPGAVLRADGKAAALPPAD